MQYTGYFLLVFGILWVCVLTGVHLWTLANAKAARDWPVVTGKVITAEAAIELDRYSRRPMWFNPRVAYRYRVGSREFSGSRLSFANLRSGSFKPAAAIVARYPAGKNVMVHYDPARPHRAVLDTRSPGLRLLLAAGIGFIYLALGMLWNLITLGHAT
jgi:hypothetical protein